MIRITNDLAEGFMLLCRHNCTANNAQEILDIFKQLEERGWCLIKAEAHGKYAMSSEILVKVIKVIPPQFNGRLQASLWGVRVINKPSIIVEDSNKNRFEMVYMQHTNNTYYSGSGMMTVLRYSEQIKELLGVKKISRKERVYMSYWILDNVDVKRHMEKILIEREELKRRQEEEKERERQLDIERTAEHERRERERAEANASISSQELEDLFGKM